MENNMIIDDNLFCCLTQEEQGRLKRDIENNNFKAVYHYQKNFVQEKTGYRCSICGAFYPYLQIKYKDEMIAPEGIAKLKGELKKYKKASTVFCGNHYYAQNKKTLLKFDMDADKNMQQTDVIPIMGDVYQVIMSQDEKYIATENFNGTIAIVDTCDKQMIAKKQKCKINGSFTFLQMVNGYCILLKMQSGAGILMKIKKKSFGKFQRNGSHLVGIKNKFMLFAIM